LVNMLRLFLMLTSSCKAKGRRLQNLVCSHFRSVFGLGVLDVRPAIMGERGCDIKFSSFGSSLVPFDVECKNVERLNLWGSWSQCSTNCSVGRVPLLVISRNRDDVLCCLRFDDLLHLLPPRVVGGGAKK